MRFAAVARVTDDRWITCAVKDDLQFGLVPGAELHLHDAAALKPPAASARSDHPPY
jgi:hypothetical protein